ncbi:ADP-ribosylglycohydrolase family protein [Schlesneria sp. T3-172]|uniref:ADP-ribosylglycohydrolase family protein n=1 Tax=Schlesneria sphaerica TaxID=3373610 RepID=UPI0037C82A8E
MDSTELRVMRAQLALEGLSVGDALGERFLSPWVRDMCLRNRIVPEGPWRWTDDTAMALGIIEVLDQHGRIDQNELASVFGRRYTLDPDRGYGPAQHDLLRSIHRGADWEVESRELFGGTGSFGNGAAMRAAPVGAYFADDLSCVVEQAALSAEVTHAHPDGVAGAIAVAVAAAWAWNRSQFQQKFPASDLLKLAHELTPSGPTRTGIEQALTIPLTEWEFDVANRLGNGSEVSSADTVPFCLWVAAAHLDSYSEALWTAIRVHGDIDTNCAIIGGIVALANGKNAIPSEWSRQRERLG